MGHPVGVLWMGSVSFPVDFWVIGSEVTVYDCVYIFSWSDIWMKTSFGELSPRWGRSFPV